MWVPLPKISIILGGAFIDFGIAQIPPVCYEAVSIPSERKGDANGPELSQ